MTRSTQTSPCPEESANGRAATPPAAPDVLDAPTLDAVRRMMRPWKYLTRRRVGLVDERFGLTRRLGLDLEQLGMVLRRVRREVPPAANGARPEDRDEDWSRRLTAHRRRQGSVAAIIDSLFGPLAQCRPELWGHRAYCLIVGMIYERLAADEREVDTPELIALAKALAQTRRSESQASVADGPAPPPTGPPPRDGELPAHFGRIVRRIYGANFDPPASSHDDEHGFSGAPAPPIEGTHGRDGERQHCAKP